MDATFSATVLRRDPKLYFRDWEFIGHGAFGDVYSATQINIDGENSKNRNTGSGFNGNNDYSNHNKDEERMVAVKQVQIDGDDAWIAAEKETLTLSACQHPNVVGYYGTYFFDQSLWVVMEYCDGGTLSQLCHYNHLSEACIAYICQELLKGLEFLHSKKRMHRDIKPANILLHLDGQVKVGDVGLLVEQDEAACRTSLAGTENYMAPEMVQGLGYGCKVDIWSLGCSVLEMCDGKPPYKDVSTIACLYRIGTQQPPTLRNPSEWSDLLLHFLDCCLQKDPTKRLSAKQLLVHPFLKNAAPRSTLSSLFVHVFLTKALKSAGLL
jgi:serine/threonine protein kinase